MRIALALALVAAVACSGPQEQPLSSWEVADLQAAKFDYGAYPGSRYRADQTDLLRRAHFVLHPGAENAPPVVVLEVDAPLEDVATWYAERHGINRIAPDQVNDFSAAPPQAHYRSGDLAADAAAAAPLFAQLAPGARPEAASGSYRAAHLNPSARFPRVSVQQPWFDVLGNEVRGSTLIILVREEPEYYSGPQP